MAAIRRQSIVGFFILLIAVGLVYFLSWLYIPFDKWFWPTCFGIGLLLLLVFSPQHRIIAGLRLLSLTDWLFMAVLPLLFITKGPSKFELKVRILLGLCFFVAEIAYIVFWRKVMVNVFWSKIRKLFGLKWKK